MGFVENVSKHKLGVRWLMAAILGPGLVLGRPTSAISLASVVYFAVEGYRIQSVAGQRGISVSELVASSGWLLRRGFLWALIVLATFYNLLISAEFTLAIISGVLLYAAGLFAQTARAAGDDRQLEEVYHERPPEDGHRGENDRQPSRTRLTDE